MAQILKFPVQASKLGYKRVKKCLQAPENQNQLDLFPRPSAQILDFAPDLGRFEQALRLDERGDIKAAVLAVHGAADPIAPKAERDAFEAEMTNAGARWALLTFGDVLHAFTDPAAASFRIALQSG